jgi:DNA excision repair protein ERCC-3
MAYALTPDEEKYGFAAQNRAKLFVIDQILQKHPDDNILVIGMYINQLEQVASRLNAPIITGQTPVPERQKLFCH